MDAPPNGMSMPSLQSPSSSPFLDRTIRRECLIRSPVSAVSRNDVSGPDGLPPPAPPPPCDVVQTSVAAPNSRFLPDANSLCGTQPWLVGTNAAAGGGGGGIAVDAATYSAVSDGLVDRFLGLHVGGGNGIVPAGSFGGVCTYPGIGGDVVEEDVLGARDRPIGPRGALLDDRRLPMDPLLDGYGHGYRAVEEERNRGALRRSAFEEYVLLSANARTQCDSLTERCLAPQRATDGPAVANADGSCAYGYNGLQSEHQASFRNSYVRGMPSDMVAYIDLLRSQRSRVDVGHVLDFMSPHPSMQVMPPELRCGLPVSKEQGAFQGDWDHQSLASGRNTRNSELYGFGDGLVLRESTLNSGQTVPPIPRYGSPAFNDQSNGQCDWGLRPPSTARTMGRSDPYGCGDSLYFDGNPQNSLYFGLPPFNGQGNSRCDWQSDFLQSPRTTRNFKTFGCDDSLIMNAKALWFPARSRQVNQRKEKRHPQHDHRVCARAGHNADIGQQHTPDNYSLSYPSLSLNNVPIHSLAKEQSGCLFLQQMLDKGNPELLDDIYNGVINHVVDLMMDPSGNFLMQKLLETCNEDQRLGIIVVATKSPAQLVKISLNPHGTRVVQKLIETLKTQRQIALVVSALKPGFLELIKDLNGNHVVQSCLVCLQMEDKKFIVDGASRHCVDIATHRHGCCVMQRCIDFATGEYQEKLVAQISANAYLLAIDAFGNYVVQYILSFESPLVIANVLSQFNGNYVTLSTQKFSSNVVEKCLKVFRAEDQARIVYELLSVPRFEQLLQDPYANYVIRTALETTKGSVYATLVEAIRPHAAALRTSPQCRQIFSMIKK